MLRKVTVFTTLFILFSISTIYSQTVKQDLLLKIYENTEQGELAEIIKRKIEKGKQIINYPSSNIQRQTTGTLNVVDSVKFTKADGTKYKESYIYNTVGDLTSYTTELWETNKWTDLDRYTIEFNVTDHSSFQLKETWDGTQWINATKTRSEYDLNNNMTYSLEETWDSTQWVNSMIIMEEFDSADRTIFMSYDYIDFSIVVHNEYDIDGNLVISNNSMYSGELLFRKTKTTNRYDSNKNITDALSEIFAEEAWEFLARTIYGHDSSNNITSELSENWNSSDSIWVNYQLRSYEFDSNKNRTLLLINYWDTEDSLWSPRYRYSSIYDSNQLITLDFCETWNTTKWINTYEYSYNYQENGNLNFATYTRWNDGTKELANSFLEFADPRNNGWNFYFTASNIDAVYYNSITDVEDKLEGVTTYSLEQNYPNPFNPSTSINFGLSKSGMVSLKVFNILGEEVATLINKTMLAGNYEQLFNASNLPSGLYIYQIKTGTFSKSKKMMLLK
jgi:Secretion system C-terminal sorting domain